MTGMLTHKTMDVVIQNATKGIILGYDVENEKRIMFNLETHFNHKPFNIKLLDHKGIDIVASDNAFISDCVFKNSKSKDLQDYFKINSNYYLLSEDFYEKDNIRFPYAKKVVKILKRDHPYMYHQINPYRLLPENYNDPLNWSLTYKMRGYTDVHSEGYPHYHKLIDSTTAFAITYNLNIKCEEFKSRWELEYENSDEVVEDEESDDNVAEEYSRSEYVSDTDSQDVHLTEEHLSALKIIPDNCIYVEYGATPEHIEIKQRNIPIDIPKASKVFDLYETGSSKPYGTVIEIAISTVSLTDYLWYYDDNRITEYNGPIINYYCKNQGIVLLGDDFEGMCYGKAVSECSYIPDVFYEVII